MSSSPVRPPCPDCDGPIRAVGPTERQPLQCESCDARFQNPRLAFLLSLVLPGLGSIYQRRLMWGVPVLLAGTGAFGWAVWRIGIRMLHVWESNEIDLAGLIHDATVGVLLVVLAFVADLLVIWVLRDHLVRVRATRVQD